MSNTIGCWRCGCEYDEDEDIFCPNCDADIEPDEMCPKCGTAYGYDDDGCPNCEGSGTVGAKSGTAKVKTKIASSEPYLAIKCSQCGGTLILNDTKMTGHCGHCMTQFVANPDIIKPTIKSAVVANSETGVVKGKHIKPVITDEELSEYKRFKNGISFQNAVDAALPRCPFCGRVARWEWRIFSKAGQPEFRCAVCFSKIKVKIRF